MYSYIKLLFNFHKLFKNLTLKKPKKLFKKVSKNVFTIQLIRRHLEIILPSTLFTTFLTVKPSFSPAIVLAGQSGSLRSF